MKVKLTKAAVIEALVGSIVEVTPYQYRFIKDRCELIEEPEVNPAPKTKRTRKPRQ